MAASEVRLSAAESLTAIAPPMLRNGVADDRGYVLRTVLRDYWPSEFGESTGMLQHDTMRQMGRPTWECIHGALLTRILDRGILRVACDPQSPVTIWGFSISEIRDGVPILHYVYVRHKQRGLGIARMLVDHLPSGWAFTHWTMAATRYMWSRAPKRVTPVRRVSHTQYEPIIPTPDGIPVYIPHLLT